MSAAIELKDVSKSFAHQPVMEKISLSIQNGEIVALLGASGGGKSTLLNLISGLLDADGGDILIQGTAAKHFQQWPHQLSGGMRSRVALARSLVVQPQIMLMDEPFSRLDPQTRSTLHNELLRIQALTAMTIIIVTHDVEEAVVLADRVVVLKPHPGRIHSQTALSLPRPRIATLPDVNEQIRLLRLEV